MSEEKSQERIKKIKEWFSNPYNAALVLVLIVAFAIRLIFYIKTQGQTLWWDEAEYMSAAKKWAFDVPYDYNPQRPPLFQALSAFAFLLGLGEQFIKFAFVLIPSVALVAAVYYLGREMFNEKVGIIASILTTVSWTLLFWTIRVQPDFFSMTFQVLAVVFMWKHWKSPNTKWVLYSGFFAALGFYFKVSALLVPMIFIVFILIKDRLDSIKDKYNYYFSAAFLGTLLPYFIWAKINFGNIFAFRVGYISAVNDFAIGWYNLNFFYSLTEGLTFILFIIGVILGLKFLLYLDLLAKDKQKCLEPNLFCILALVFISAFYIFYIRNTDDRWVFLWLPFIFLLVAQPLTLIYEKVSKKQKFIAGAIVILLLGLCVYAQFSHANTIIELKKDSYYPVKNAALWIKANSDKDDKVFSISYTQAVYYSERNVSTFSGAQSANDLDKMILEHKPRYIMISFFERHPTWLIQQGSQEGYDIISMQYLNSTIVMQNGRLVANDLKPSFNKGFATFNLVYPTNQIDGVFVYEITYPGNYYS